ncbi:MAG: hypothetical protein GY788_24770 [bacterium]|nr:hypothetical protein [bacterium]
MADETLGRRTILEHLRDLSRRQAKTSKIENLDLQAISQELSLPVDTVQDVLVDLATEGLVEGFAESYGNTVADGACRITESGMRELRGQP